MNRIKSKVEKRQFRPRHMKLKSAKTAYQSPVGTSLRGTPSSAQKVFSPMGGSVEEVDLSDAAGVAKQLNLDESPQRHAVSPLSLSVADNSRVPVTSVDFFKDALTQSYEASKMARSPAHSSSILPRLQEKAKLQQSMRQQKQEETRNQAANSKIVSRLNRRNIQPAPQPIVEEDFVEKTANYARLQGNAAPAFVPQEGGDASEKPNAIGNLLNVTTLGLSPIAMEARKMRARGATQQEIQEFVEKARTPRTARSARKSARDQEGKTGPKRDLDDAEYEDWGKRIVKVELERVQRNQKPSTSCTAKLSKIWSRIMCSSAEDEMALQGMVIDGTAGQLVQALKLKSRHMVQLKRRYDEIHLGMSKDITFGDFMDFFEEPRSSFTDMLLMRLLRVEERMHTFEFPEFLTIVITISILNRIELLRFVFNVFDTDASGALEEQEFVKLIETINSKGPIFPGNHRKAMQDFDEDGDGTISWAEFRKIHDRLPMVFFPAFRLQDKIQRKVLGRNVWMKLVGRQEEETPPGAPQD